MPRNKITDLNNHLFAQLEKLNDDELTAEQINLECKRAKAMSSIASQILSSAKITLEAMKLVNEDKVDSKNIPKLLQNNDNE
jgi:hypothetical protein